LYWNRIYHDLVDIDSSFPENPLWTKKTLTFRAPRGAINELLIRIFDMTPRHSNGEFKEEVPFKVCCLICEKDTLNHPRLMAQPIC